MKETAYDQREEGLEAFRRRRRGSEGVRQAREASEAEDAPATGTKRLLSAALSRIEKGATVDASTWSGYRLLEEVCDIARPNTANATSAKRERTATPPRTSGR
jgi:hypothetical protein